MRTFDGIGIPGAMEKLDEFQWEELKERESRLLTKLWPDIRETRVPQTHIELVVGGEQDGLLNGGLRHRLLHLDGQERATMVSIRKHHCLHSWEPLGRREFSQSWVVERLQVQ